MGTIVDIKEHSGWTGSLETSWKTVSSIKANLNKDNTIKQPLGKKLNQINGVDNIIYWSDITSEIAFIIPNGAKNTSQTSNSNTLVAGLMSI